MALKNEDNLTDEYLEQIRNIKAREALIAEIGMEEYERRERERRWNERVDADAAALRPGAAQTITLSDGTQMEVREPLAMAWMRALGRVARTLDPLISLWAMSQGAHFKAMNSADQAATALALLTERAAGDADALEQMTRDLFGALDALLGQEDGWTETHAHLEDVARLTLALIRVSRLEELKYFFAQARAAAAAKWRACQQRAS
jgi:hypothetical protein